jgi:hypothetical protein
MGDLRAGYRFLAPALRAAGYRVAHVGRSYDRLVRGLVRAFSEWTRDS